MKICHFMCVDTPFTRIVRGVHAAEYPTIYSEIIPSTLALCMTNRHVHPTSHLGTISKV